MKLVTPSVISLRWTIAACTFNIFHNAVRDHLRFVNILQLNAKFGTVLLEDDTFFNSIFEEICQCRTAGDVLHRYASHAQVNFTHWLSICSIFYMYLFHIQFIYIHAYVVFFLNYEHDVVVRMFSWSLSTEELYNKKRHIRICIICIWL